MYLSMASFFSLNSGFNSSANCTFFSLTSSIFFTNSLISSSMVFTSCALVLMRMVSCPSLQALTGLPSLKIGLLSKGQVLLLWLVYEQKHFSQRTCRSWQMRKQSEVCSKISLKVQLARLQFLQEGDSYCILIVIYSGSMKDQQVQAMEGFSGRYKEYQITLRIVPEDGSLEIKVEDGVSLGRWMEVINTKYIQETKDFINIFEEPVEILDYFMHNFQQISVEGETIKFQYTFGSLKKRVKAITIPLKKVEVDPLQLANRRIEKLQEDFKNDVRVRDARIEVLEVEVRKMEAENCNLMDELAEFKEARARSEKEVKELREILMRCMAENEELMKHRKAEIEDCMFEHLPGNPHSKFYELQPTGLSTARLVFLGSDGKWYNFINKTEVNVKVKTKYSVKINKITNKWLMLGFCTKNGSGVQDNYKSTESVYYSCTGSSFQGGSYHPLSESTPIGETIDCVADYLNKQFMWMKNGKTIATCKMHKDMCGCPVYFSVIICRQGDEVELRA